MFPNNLFGFRASHYTTYLLHKLDDAVSLSLESRKYYSCVFHDIFHVVVRVWHTGLLYKPKNFLPPTHFLLIRSYLTNRYLWVRFGSSFSGSANSGVEYPQNGEYSNLFCTIYTNIPHP